MELSPDMFEEHRRPVPIKERLWRGRMRRLMLVAILNVELVQR